MSSSLVAPGERGSRRERTPLDAAMVGALIGVAATAVVLSLGALWWAGSDAALGVGTAFLYVDYLETLR